jgi:hypothetical protein
MRNSIGKPALLIALAARAGVAETIQLTDGWSLFRIDSAAPQTLVAAVAIAEPTG